MCDVPMWPPAKMTLIITIATIFNAMLSVIVLSVIMLSVIMLRVIILKVVVLNVSVLNVERLC